MRIRIPRRLISMEVLVLLPVLNHMARLGRVTISEQPKTRPVKLPGKTSISNRDEGRESERIKPQVDHLPVSLGHHGKGDAKAGKAKSARFSCFRP